MAKAKTSEISQELVDPGTLKFDFENPRFIDQNFRNEEEVIRYLYDNADVDELIQSILSAGYIDFDPLIVLKPKRIVLEGNRRLAALRLMTNAELRAKLDVQLPTIPNSKAAPNKVRVRWVTTRDEARFFIGFKHINGPMKWDALAKAKYAATWFEEGGDIDTIGRTLGDTHNTVRRLVNGWYTLQQALADGFDLAQISKKSFSFSHLYTALTRSAVREFVGLSGDDLSAPPRKNPIPKKNKAQLSQLMSWLYGQEDKGEPTLIQSQNPNLNELSRVLEHPRARLMLIANRSLEDAFKLVSPDSSRFEENLMRAAKQTEDALGLAGAYDGDATLMRVAENMNKTTRSLVAAMKAKNEEDSGDE